MVATLAGGSDSFESINYFFLAVTKEPGKGKIAEGVEKGQLLTTKSVKGHGFLRVFFLQFIKLTRDTLPPPVQLFWDLILSNSLASSQVYHYCAVTFTFEPTNSPILFYAHPKPLDLATPQANHQFDHHHCHHRTGLPLSQYCHAVRSV